MHVDEDTVLHSVVCSYSINTAYIYEWVYIVMCDGYIIHVHVFEHAWTLSFIVALWSIDYSYHCMLTFQLEQ